MKSVGYTLLILVSAITFTPMDKIEEIPVRKIELNTVHQDSLNKILKIKIDSLESTKEEIIRLQKEIGVRK